MPRRQELSELNKPTLDRILRARIRRYHQNLEQELPDDARQEIALFLLKRLGGVDEKTIKNTSKLSKEEIETILRDFGRHLYHWQKAISASHQFGRRRHQVELYPTFEDGEFDESKSTYLRSDFWKDFEDVRWMQEHIGICETVIKNTNDPEAEIKWQVFELFLGGRNTITIGRILRLQEKIIRYWLEDSITRIRKAVGIEDAEPFTIPESKNIQKGEFGKRSTTHVRVVINPTVSIENIVEQYGVSRATAYRMRQRASEHPNHETWYIPDYQSKYKPT